MPAPNVIAGRIYRNNIHYDSRLGGASASGTKANNAYFQSGSTGEPGQLLMDPLFNNYAGNNFTLQAGSRDRGTGLSLGYTADLLGHAVPVPPDRGAYQAQGGSGDITPPLSPANVRVQ